MIAAAPAWLNAPTMFSYGRCLAAFVFRQASHEHAVEAGTAHVLCAV